MGSHGCNPWIPVTQLQSTLKGLNPMSTYTQILYHVVFSTKNRVRALDAPRRPELFKYIWGILQNKHCHLHRINGVEDHLHLLFELHPSIALSDLIKDIKLASNSWIKQNDVFPNFPGWQSGYSAFTHALPDRDRIIQYIKTQEEHHRELTFQDELQQLLNEAGIAFEATYA